MPLSLAIIHPPLEGGPDRRFSDTLASITSFFCPGTFTIVIGAQTPSSVSGPALVRWVEVGMFQPARIGFELRSATPRLRPQRPCALWAHW